VRKVLCSIGAGPHEALLDLSGETFRIFAERHDYELDLRRELLAPERAPSWSKIPLFRELLDRYDLVLWIDADAAVVDPTLDPADELRPHDLMGLVAHEVDGQVVPNCGVWLLRRDPDVVAFLDRVWARTEYIAHKWWENAALLAELGYSTEPHVEIVEPSPMRQRTTYLDRSWNSIRIDTAAHPRINHYPGRSDRHRLNHLATDLATARSIAAALERRSGAPTLTGLPRSEA
jgi:hypothetical protein